MAHEENINTEEDWARYAAALVAGLSGGEVFALSGPLGAGKTTLVQAVARNLGIVGRVTSPTFVLAKTYPVTGKPFGFLCHADLYRTPDGEVPEALAECFGEKDTVCFVEWAEKISSKLPKNTTVLSIAILPGGGRGITKTSLPPGKEVA